MSEDNPSHHHGDVPQVGPSEPLPPDEPLTGRQKLRLVVLVILKRLRFIAILLAVGMFIGYWDTVKNYWDKWTRSGSVSVHQLEPGLEFFCPMDPQVVRSDYEPNGDVPNCPICGMPLSIRNKAKPEALPAGITGRVQLSPERIQLAGIKTAPVEYRPMVKQIRTVGYVAYDEGRLSRVVSRVEGYVEKLYVDQTFTVVHKGDRLAEIYSPELYSTAQELLLSTRRGAGADLAASARKRLLLFGVSPEEIDAIVASGRAMPRLVIRSPRSGFVTGKKIVAGSSVERGMTLLEIADLSTVWIEADVYEKDIAFLQAGERVQASVEAFPNSTFSGRLALVYPQLDPATRTNRVRFEVDNPRYGLRPGMFATVRIDTPLEAVEPYKSLAASAGRARPAVPDDGSRPPRHEFLAVPERAVIDTGDKKVVYVEREPGLFEGMEVELGPRNGEYYPVFKGLKAGDMVAAAGGFLIDAETRLNPAAASTYFGASGGPSVTERAKPRAASATPEKTKPPAAVLSEADLQNIAKLSPEDRVAALAQKMCPITGAALGSMGVPVKIVLQGQPVFLCCGGCVAKAKSDPAGTLRKVAELKRAEKRGQASWR